MVSRQQKEECKRRNMAVVQKCYDPCAPNKYCGPGIKRSMSFLTSQELLSYKAIPAFGVVAYLGAAIGTLAHEETFVRWFGSEYTAVNVMNSLTLSSVLGAACYIYGRRHIRHAGAFQKMVYPLFGSLSFNVASHFFWAFTKETLSEQDCFDYHWRCLSGLLSGLVFIYTGRSYLKFIDHW